MEPFNEDDDSAEEEEEEEVTDEEDVQEPEEVPAESEAEVCYRVMADFTRLLYI